MEGASPIRRIIRLAPSRPYALYHQLPAPTTVTRPVDHPARANMPDHQYAWIHLPPALVVVATQASYPHGGSSRRTAFSGSAYSTEGLSPTQAATLEERVKQMELEDNYHQIKEEIQAHKESKRLDDQLWEEQLLQEGALRARRRRIETRRRCLRPRRCLPRRPKVRHMVLTATRHWLAPGGFWPPASGSVR